MYGTEVRTGHRTKMRILRFQVVLDPVRLSKPLVCFTIQTDFICIVQFLAFLTATKTCTDWEIMSIIAVRETLK